MVTVTHGTVPRETWAPIKGFSGYEVSDQGRVRSPAGRIIGKPSHVRGYVRVVLPGNQQRLVHQLVAAAFIGPANGRRVRRIDTSDPTDNRASNLRYGL